MVKSRKPQGQAAKTLLLPESHEKLPSLKIIVIVSTTLVLLNLIIYAPSLHFGFLHYDDPIYVSENVEVSQGFTWHGLLWAFNLGYAANWHPLTWLSHMLDVQLYGMVAEYHHLTSILLHMANSLLLFLLLCRTTRAWRRSAVVALLFAVHPLHVESVAWIAERKDVFSTLFWMLTFHAYVSYVRQPLHRRRPAVLVIFALGLMAKPMLITLPFVLLLFDIWPLGRLNPNAGRRRVWLPLVLEKIPLFALSAVSGIFTIVAQWRGGAVQNFDMLPFSQRAANAVVSYVMYIVQMLWPRNLIAYYSYEPHSVALVLVSILILASVSTLAIRFSKPSPYFLVGWIWYLCALLPVIGLIQVGEQSRADRYTYVPLIGVFIAAAWGIPKLLENHRRLISGVGIAAGILICVFTALARNQVAYWENDLTLWEHAVKSAPRNCFARTNLGTALTARGDLEAAVDQYAEALRIKPNSAETHNGLGIVLFKKGMWREAALHYAEALRIKPRFAEAHGNMGIVLGTLGKNEEAISEFKTALKIDPQKAEIHYDLGFSLAGQGKIDEAIAQYKKALEIKPLYPEAHTELGNALLLKGELRDAIEHYNKALEINPELENAHNNLGLALMTQKRFPEAISHFNEALRIDPNNIQAQRNLEAAIKSQ